MTSESLFNANQEEQIKYLSNLRVMIATPCYGGMAHESYVRGIMRISSMSALIKMPINLTTVINESLVTRARNELVKHFMLSDCTHLFFIDSDIGFTEIDVLQLLLHKKEVIVGAYPLKGLAWSNIDASQHFIEFEKAATSYAVNVRYLSDQDRALNKVALQDGLIELIDASTGFMCIERSVIEKMIASYPETYHYKETQLISQEDDGSRYALFDTMIDEDDRYLSEDYTFCRRWQKLGGKVWLEPQLALTHAGSYLFKGYPLAKNIEQFLAFLLELCYYINISKTADQYTEDKMNTLIAASGGKINHEMFQHFLMMVGLIFVLPPTIFLSLRAVYYRITGGK